MADAADLYGPFDRCMYAAAHVGEAERMLRETREEGLVTDIALIATRASLTKALAWLPTELTETTNG